ncbi:hypothetical protein [Formosa algae]|uniref:hypothetical protein n=1 Tax=Formosa algae TaxID=225843 RepID=UPI000CCEC088|nr:hypothetical protein [Formosa algae]PNW27225.1 hypothetical protein BKP44_14130 [Formosa algae]
MQKAETEKQQLIYDGIIKYKCFKKDKRYKKEEFEISLDHFKNKVRPITDQQDFYLKNSKLNETVTKINKTMTEFIDKIDK